MIDGLMMAGDKQGHKNQTTILPNTQVDENACGLWSGDGDGGLVGFNHCRSYIFVSIPKYRTQKTGPSAVGPVFSFHEMLKN